MTLQARSNAPTMAFAEVADAPSKLVLLKSSGMHSQSRAAALNASVLLQQLQGRTGGGKGGKHGQEVGAWHAAARPHPPPPLPPSPPGFPNLRL